MRNSEKYFSKRTQPQQQQSRTFLLSGNRNGLLAKALKGRNLGCGRFPNIIVACCDYVLAHFGGDDRCVGIEHSMLASKREKIHRVDNVSRHSLDRLAPQLAVAQVPIFLVCRFSLL